MSEEKQQKKGTKRLGIFITVGIVMLAIIGGVLLLKVRSAFIKQKENKEVIVEIDGEPEENEDSPADELARYEEDPIGTELSKFKSDEEVPANAEGKIRELLERHLDELDAYGYGVTVDEIMEGTISRSNLSDYSYIIESGDYITDVDLEHDDFNLVSKENFFGEEPSEEQEMLDNVLSVIAVNDESALVPANITKTALSEKIANKEYTIEKTDQEYVYKVNKDGVQIYFDSNNNTITVEK